MWDILCYGMRSCDLIRLGHHIVFHGKLVSLTNNRWVFEFDYPEIGDLDTIKEYIASFNQNSIDDSYIIVESLELDNARSVEVVGWDEINKRIEVIVQPPVAPTDPNKYGSSLAVDDSGDLAPGMVIVRGLEAAKQYIAQAMGTKKGEWRLNPEVGTFVSEYYSKYHSDLEMLERLIKMEMTRLTRIPIPDSDSELRIPLQVVKRIVNVTITSAELSSQGRLSARVELEWGSGETWATFIPLFIHPDNRLSKE